jgi:hypothetical protein
MEMLRRKRTRFDAHLPGLGPTAVCTLLVSAFLPAPTRAQSLDLRRPTPHPGLWAAVRWVDMSSEDAVAPIVPLDFSGTLLTVGATFIAWRQQGELRVGYGRESAAEAGETDRSLLEAELLFWPEIPLVDDRVSVGLRFPLLFSYRRLGVVDSPVEDDVLGIWRVGVGGGLGLGWRLAQRASLEARATPFLGMTVSRTQQDQFVPEVRGIYDLGATLHLERVLGDRSGLSLGFVYRSQTLAAGGAFFPDAPEDQDWFDFRSSETEVRFGVHW